MKEVKKAHTQTEAQTETPKVVLRPIATKVKTFMSQEAIELANAICADRECGSFADVLVSSPNYGIDPIEFNTQGVVIKLRARSHTGLKTAYIQLTLNRVGVWQWQQTTAQAFRAAKECNAQALACTVRFALGLLKQGKSLSKSVRKQLWAIASIAIAHSEEVKAALSAAIEEAKQLAEIDEASALDGAPVHPAKYFNPNEDQLCALGKFLINTDQYGKAKDLQWKAQERLTPRARAKVS